MYRHPEYERLTSRPAEPQPPAEDGERLLTLPRGGEQELRLNLCEYEGRPYLALRLWERGRGGAWFPTRKGCSIRMHEAGQLAEVLARVAQDRPAQSPQDRSGASRGARDGGSYHPGPRTPTGPRGAPQEKPLREAGGSYRGASDVRGSGDDFSESF